MLRLRPYRRSDAEEIISWIKNERIFRFWCADRFDHYPITAADLNDQYDNSPGAEDVYHLTAYDEQGIAGHLNIRFPDKNDLNTVRFGYVILDDSRRGQGLGKEMVSMALDFAFGSMRARKVTIGVFAENAPALKCYLSCGFKDTGIVETYPIDGSEWKCLELECTRVEGYKGEFRKVFDTIPEQFDRYRLRYSEELFAALIAYAGIGPGKSVLELGPGTGQATEPILRTGCDYNAIELGEHLYAKMKEKYDHLENFHIVNDDFITHDFGEQKFDMIYSAATIQWIPEDIAFSKTFALLKPGGTLAMILCSSDYKSTNEPLYEKIQSIYDQHFKPETWYKFGGFDYDHATDYGYVDFERKDFYGVREMNADDYVAFCGTHCDHIVIPEPHKTRFFEGLRSVVAENGNKVVFNDTYILYTAKKPLS